MATTKKQRTTFNRWDVIMNKSQSKAYRILDNVSVWTGSKDGEKEDYLVVKQLGKTKISFIKKSSVKDWINFY